VIAELVPASGISARPFEAVPEVVAAPTLSGD